MIHSSELDFIKASNIDNGIKALGLCEDQLTQNSFSSTGKFKLVALSSGVYFFNKVFVSFFH
jgi:hypothetical protein